MIDDDHRGYLLELMTTKLLSLGQPIQVIAMSATLPVGKQDHHRSSTLTWRPRIWT